MRLRSRSLTLTSSGRDASEIFPSTRHAPRSRHAVTLSTSLRGLHCGQPGNDRPIHRARLTPTPHSSRRRDRCRRHRRQQTSSIVQTYELQAGAAPTSGCRALGMTRRAIRIGGRDADPRKVATPLFTPTAVNRNRRSAAAAALRKTLHPVFRELAVEAVRAARAPPHSLAATQVDGSCCRQPLVLPKNWLRNSLPGRSATAYGLRLAGVHGAATYYPGSVRHGRSVSSAINECSTCRRRPEPLARLRLVACTPNSPAAAPPSRR